MSNTRILFKNPYRHRYIWLIIKLAVILHIFMSSNDVKAVIFLLFRCQVSGKTICQWSQKFVLEIPTEKVNYNENETVILFADEKYVWIKKTKAYWWSVRDHTGKVLASIITLTRCSESAKELFRRARERIDGKVHAVVHDGLKSYPKAVHWIFGRKCKSIVAGIKKRVVIINHKTFWITNNSAESLNSQIDNYISKIQYNFDSIESANRFANMFLYRMHLRDACT